MFDNIALAIPELFTLTNMLLMMLGTTAGLFAGAIPGFTIAMAVVLVLPFTFSMTPVQGLATMVSVYVGGLSGGLISGILTGIPGTPSSVATTFDGYPLARSGKPGLALGIGVWSSFFGGVFASIVLLLVAPQLARIGLEFQPVDYFSLVIFALTVTASLAGDDMVKGLLAGLFGLLVATVGSDVVFGQPRFTFGMDAMEQGFAFLPVLVGIFAFGRLLGDVKNRDKAHRPLGGEAGRCISTIWAPCAKCCAVGGTRCALRQSGSLSACCRRQGPRSRTSWPMIRRRNPARSRISSARAPSMESSRPRPPTTPPPAAR